jgi:hypothetical protein
MNIELDKPIEVTSNQYKKIVSVFEGLIAHRYDSKLNKYYIKLWFGNYKNHLLNFLTDPKLK